MKFGEITEKMIAVNTAVSIFGSTKEFNVEYKKQVFKIGKAIRKEKNLATFEDCEKLSPETELKSKNVSNLFNKLCQWLATQHPDFK